MERTLEMLRDVVTTQEQAKRLVVPLREVLSQIQNSEEGRRASLAAYLLAITSEGTEAKVAVDKLDDQTLYAYLEYLVRTSPAAHVGTFRRYLYDDLFVLRLMSAAGLWRVLGAGATKDAPAAADDASEATEETAEPAE